LLDSLLQEILWTVDLLVHICVVIGVVPRTAVHTKIS